MNAWLSFFLRYILVGIIGTAAITFLLPTDKSEQQALIKLTRDKLKIEQLDIGQLAVMFKSFTDNTTEAEQDMEIEQQVNLNVTDSETSAPAEYSDNQPKLNHTKSPTATHNNSTRWGIVSEPKATYYTSKGKFIGHLSPGTALNIIKITQTKKGPLAVCRPFKQPSSDIILINPDRLTVRYNDINSISKDLEQLYVQQAQLTAEITTVKKQKAKELRRDNPHARKYAICKKEYHDYWRKVKELTKKRDTASNKSQMDYADELRLMKGQDIRIANELEAVKSDYDNWNLAHPRLAKNDNEVNKLLTELARIGKIISSMEKS